MYSTLAFQEAEVNERRYRYETRAAGHRLLHGIRHRKSAHRAPAALPAGDQVAAARASTPLGRTSSGVEQRAA